MKKVKIMLLAITVLGATGGVFAFKAKFSPQFCTVATTAPGSCATGAQSCALATSKFTDQGDEVCYTLTQSGNCNGVTNCNNLTQITDEGTN